MAVENMVFRDQGPFRFSDTYHFKVSKCEITLGRSTLLVCSGVKEFASLKVHHMMYSVLPVFGPAIGHEYHYGQILALAILVQGPLASQVQAATLISPPVSFWACNLLLLAL